MVIRVIAVGKLKEKFWQEGVAEYAKRLRPYARLEWVEVPELRLPEGNSAAAEQQVMEKEGAAILERLDRLGARGPVVVLDRQGRMMDSEELAEWLNSQLLAGQKEITWVIGGTLGLSPAVRERADLIFSFSRLTFPHQMVRLLLAEQLYRCFKIIRREPYHY